MMISKDNIRTVPEDLQAKEFDLLVIGGGIYGACIAWDASLRGLSVALVERDDFGGAASANSLKTIHGGLRYLQDGNLKLVRTMIKERKTWMRIAPHMVYPISCLMPTSRRKLTQHKLTLSIALLISDLLSYDRNRGMEMEHRLPNSRILSRAEYEALAPGLSDRDISGGALWYDAQMRNSERLSLSILLSAAEHGAAIANYTEVIGFLKSGNRLCGVAVRDQLLDKVYEIKARQTINATGAWSDSILKLIDDRISSPKFRPSVAVNLVTRQILPGDYAIVAPSKHTCQQASAKPDAKTQLLFLVPWRCFTLIGTLHLPHAGPLPDHPVSEGVVQNFIDSINSAYPPAALTRQDVYQVHAGYLPQAGGPSRVPGEVNLLRKGSIHDHEKADGVSGLITVVGVKYTTARIVAERAVDLAIQKLGRPRVPCKTSTTPVFGGDFGTLDGFPAAAIADARSPLPAEIIQRLVRNYGSRYQQLLAHIDRNPDLARPLCDGYSVIGAEVVHAVRHEMAQTLADVVLRRTELGMAGLPDSKCLSSCAELIAAELDWDDARTQEEIETLVQTSKSTGKRIMVGQQHEQF